MPEAYIVDTVRTPRGRAGKKGALAQVTPLALLETVLSALVDRTGIDPARIEEVVVGSAGQVGEQGSNLARTAVLTLGWPVTVPGVAVNRFCSSGLDALAIAAALVRSGQADVVVAAGVESVSRVPMFSDKGPLWSDPQVVEKLGSVHMGVAADLNVTELGYARDELDAYGFRTQQLAARAWKNGFYDRSVIPVGGLTHDELVRPGTTLESLAALEPLFTGFPEQDALVLRHLPHLKSLNHLHTLGTSPSLADAAGAVLVVSDRVELPYRARIVGASSAGSDPVHMLLAGQAALKKVLARNDLTPDDLDAVEFAEAFAALCLKIQRELGFGDDRFNVNGGTIAMGHAFGATGIALTAGLVDELHHRNGRFGVAAVSGAAGSGAAVLLERTQ